MNQCRSSITHGAVTANNDNEIFVCCYGNCSIDPAGELDTKKTISFSNSMYVTYLFRFHYINFSKTFFFSIFTFSPIAEFCEEVESSDDESI